MTEQEAKTKWCPAAKIPLGSLCIGSPCMAFRWLPVPVKVVGNSIAAEWPAPPPTEGFCGLAGKP